MFSVFSPTDKTCLTRGPFLFLSTFDGPNVAAQRFDMYRLVGFILLYGNEPEPETGNRRDDQQVKK
jgi:hypothetical protein